MGVLCAYGALFVHRAPHGDENNDDDDGYVGGGAY